MIRTSTGLAIKSIHTKSGVILTEPWSSTMYFDSPMENRVRFLTDYFEVVRVKGIQKFFKDLTMDEPTIDLFTSVEYNRRSNKYVSNNLSRRIHIVNWKEYKITSEEFDLYEGFGKIALIKDVAVNDVILYAIDKLLYKNKSAPRALIIIVTSEYLIHFGTTGDVIDIISTDPKNIRNIKMNYKGIFDTYYDAPLS